jgi:RNA polymerase primary sigma factor
VQVAEAAALPEELDIFAQAARELYRNTETLAGIKVKATAERVYLNNLTAPLLNSIDKEVALSRSHEAGTTARMVLHLLGVELDVEGYRAEEDGKPKPGISAEDRPQVFGEMVKQITDGSGSGRIKPPSREVAKAKITEVFRLAGRIAAGNGMDTSYLLSESELSEADAEQLPRLDELEILVREGKQARDVLIEANLRLAASLAKQYSNVGEFSYGDLIQESNLGLMYAVDKYDWARGYRFSTNAVPVIRHYIRTALAERSRSVPLPIHRFDKLNQLLRFENELYLVLRRKPTVAEIAAKEGKLTPEKAGEILRDGRKTTSISMQTPLGNESTPLTLGDVVADEKTIVPTDLVDDRLLCEWLIKNLGSLGDDRIPGIIISRLGLDDDTPVSVDELGKRYSISGNRVRQLETVGLTFLREQMTDESVADPQAA